MPRVRAYHEAYPPCSPAGRKYGTERKCAYELAKKPEVAALIEQLQQEAAAVVARYHRQRMEARELGIHLFVEAAQSIAAAKAVAKAPGVIARSV